jgi:phosphoglucomutase
MKNQRYNNWLNSPLVDEATKAKIRLMDEKTIEDHFGKELEYGTGGIRAILAPGSNKLNIFTIRKASLAFAQYLLRHHKDARSKGVVIAHDNRLMSREFTLEAARIFASNGIKAYIFKSLRPTPQLSFSVRHLKAVGGIVITASHNPKEYNGFKPYGPDGGQLVPSQIEQLLPFYQTIENELEVKVVAKADDPLIEVLDESLDKLYFDQVYNITLNKTLRTDDFKIVYSPQHGAGFQGVNYLLTKLGYHLINVEEQSNPDPNFSGTSSPNPEEARAYDLAVKKAIAHKADIILTTDPDADRLGLVIIKDNQPLYFSGNQTGALLIDYIIRFLKNNDLFKKNHILFNTIVTSNLGAKIALSHGVKVVSTLTGFKFIGEQIRLLEDDNKFDFLFGYEESYGYLIDETIARDKDALQAVVLIAEMANYYSKIGKTLDVALEELYQKYGYHIEEVESITMPGVDGSARIKEIMALLRAKPLTKIGGSNVAVYEDYATSTQLKGQIKTTINLAPSDVLRYTLDNETVVAVRPSGTEPKIKFYYNGVGESKQACLQQISLIKKEIKDLIK